MDFKIKDLMIKVLPDTDANKSALGDLSPHAPRRLSNWSGYNPDFGPIRWPGGIGGWNNDGLNGGGVDDCGYCTGCSDCSGCTGCSPCTGCSGCSSCSGCSNCTGCTGCSGCTPCGSLGCTSSCHISLFSDGGGLPDDLIELDKIRTEIGNLMSAVDKQAERIESKLQPQSVEELDMLEERLLESLEEVRAQRDKLK